MARNPEPDLGAIGRDVDTAQLLSDILVAQHRQERHAAQLRDRLRAIRTHQQNLYAQRSTSQGNEARIPVHSAQDRLRQLGGLHLIQERNVADDVAFAYGPLERLCDLVLAELSREESEDEEDVIEDQGPAVEVARTCRNQYNPYNRERSPPLPRVIRPTGRAIRRRVAYTISSQPRQNNFFEVALDLPDHDFRIVFRMCKRTFWSIVDLIRQDEVFVNRGRRKQRPVFYQLGAFLIRFGSMGSRGDFTALITSVGQGSVPIYCEQRKNEIKAAFREMCGLDGIVGVLDGSLIELAKRPAGLEESFRSRKETIATNIQAIVDHEGRFIAFETGFPGSKNDTSIWKQSFIWSHRLTHFDDGEFLLADGGWISTGYPLSPFVLIPFARHERQGEDRPRKVQFNRCISRARVLVERTFGKLKSRFPSLVMMGDIGNPEVLYRVIEALMVLHNICYDLHDTVSGESDAFIEAGGEYDWVDWEEEDVHVGPGANINEEVLTAGREFRIRCMDKICPE
ncbi:DDE superfamily endonuclease [Rhizoctonia solani]|uniref:DDE superfamily endonuclease n=1 Tax=Rhizoctonia solani TaxID=456999 RepID=A0A8H7LRY5_9AGAM|nr:DDE superfamily endonuclease [Rhizoctonia solani]